MTEGQGDTLLVLKGNTPNSLALSNELTDQVTGLEVPDLDAAITSTTDDAGVVELQTGNTIVMSCETVNRAHLLEGPDTDGTVRATGHEGVTAHLQLANKASVALKNGKTLAGERLALGRDMFKRTGSTHAVRGSQMRTLVSRLPVTTRFPSKAMA